VIANKGHGELKENEGGAGGDCRGEWEEEEVDGGGGKAP
jgi:hypothetical protein